MGRDGSDPLPDLLGRLTAQQNVSYSLSDVGHQRFVSPAARGLGYTYPQPLAAKLGRQLDRGDDDLVGF